MSRWRWLVRRARVLFRKAEEEAELDAEMRYHLEQEMAELERGGMSRADARRRALRDFGGVERFKEEVRDVRGARLVDDLIQDTRVACRSLPRQPAFLLAVVVTLAVGIAGSVAMLSVVDATSVRSLPYPDADRLVLGRSTFDGELGPYVSAQDFEDYRDRVAGLEAVGAIAPFSSRSTVTGGGDAERIDLVVVSPDLFRVLGVAPILGRHFRNGDATRDAAPVVMLSYGYWQRRFGGSPDVVGKTLVLNGNAHEVVGVMPEGFRFYLDTDAWQPYHLGVDVATGRRNHNFLLVGRLGRGASRARVQSEADAVSAELAAEYPTSNEGKALLLTPLQSTLVREYRSTLAVLLMAALLILLVACANVGGLLLARGSARGPEMAVRTVMGAGGGRLVRQLLTESALIASVAGAIGVLLGVWVRRGILAFLSLNTLGHLEEGLSWRMLALAAAVTTGTVFLAGLLPAIRASRTDAAGDLRSGSRTSVGRAGTGFRNGLVIAQITLTTMLLAISGLLLRSFVEARRVDPGFDPRSLITAEVQVPGNWPVARRLDFFTELRARMAALPGVVSVAMGSHLPIRDPGSIYGIQRADADAGADLRNVSVSQRLILPGYFRAMGIPLLAGRGIEPEDRADSEPVIVLSESTARHLFGRESAVGRTVEAMGVGGFAPRTVVGVVGDVVLGDPVQGRDMAMYYPWTQLDRNTMRMAVRVQGDAASIIAGVRGILRAEDANVPLDDVRTMEEAIAGAVSDRRGTATVTLVFALTALILAGVGLYGVLAHRVSLRRREIGIRMALGASSRGVTLTIVRSGLIMVLSGLTVGSIAALGVGNALQGMLFGIGGHDPLTFAALVLVLGLVGVLASVLPARRAARVRPTDVIRME